MDLFEVKWIVLFSLFFLTLIFSVIPLKLVGKFHNTLDLNRRLRYGRIISLLNCFAGGVFMATGLLDLLPDTRQTLSDGLINMSVKTSFPVTEFCVTIGFFLVLLAEQIALYFQEHSHNTYILLDSKPEERQGYSSANLEGLMESISVSNRSEILSESEPHSVLRSLLLLIALSIHSLFEGIAIGLQPKLGSIIQIFLAVVIHKIVIAFSLGLNLVQSQMKLKTIIKSIFGFCVISPLGMGIAMCIEGFSKSINCSIYNGILQGLACGTFVYITFFEVLPHELNKSHDRLLKLLCLLLGFSLITLTILYETHPKPI